MSQQNHNRVTKYNMQKVDRSHFELHFLHKRCYTNKVYHYLSDL